MSFVFLNPEIFITSPHIYVNKDTSSHDSLLEAGDSKGYDLLPNVKKILSDVGDCKIIGISIVRMPISEMIRGLLNIISLGEFQKSLAKTPYVSAYKCIYVCMYLGMCVCDTYIYTHKHTYICLYECICVCMNV